MKTKMNKVSTDSLKERFDIKYQELIEACNENINSLVQESKLLFENKYYARSFMLSYSALEELGKRLLIADFISGIVSKNELMQSFYDHKIKIAYLHNYAIVSKEKDGTIDVEVVYNNDKYAHWIKERHKALYVDFKKNSEVVIPNSEISEEYAKSILEYLYKSIKDTNYYESVNGRLGSKAFYK